MRQIFAGDVLPTLSTARDALKEFHLVVPVSEATSADTESFCLFSSDPVLSTRTRHTAVSVVRRRRSLNAMDDKRLRLSTSTGCRSADCSLVGSDTSLMEEWEPVDDVKQFFEKKDCRRWNSTRNVRVSLVDLVENQSFEVELMQDVWEKVLTRVCEQDSRNSWKMLKGIQTIVKRRCSRELTKSEQFVVKCAFGRKTSESFASEFLLALMLHSTTREDAASICSCGIRFVWSKEEYDEIRQLFCEASRAIVWIVQTGSVSDA